MKVRFLVILLLNLIFASSAFADNKLIAKVGNKYITNIDIEKKYQMLLKNNPNIPKDETIYQHILQLLVEESIQIQEAEKFGTVASKKEIEAKIDEIVSNHPGISKNDKELNHHIKAALSWVNLINAKFRNGIKISEIEIDNAIKLHRKSLNVEVAQIVIPAGIFDNEPTKIEDMVKVINSCNAAYDFTKELSIHDPIIIKEDVQNLNEIVRNIVENGKLGQASNLISDADHNKHFFVVCKKDTVYYSDKDKAEVKNMLIEKKLSLLAKNYLTDLKKQYYIEIKK